MKLAIIGLGHAYLKQIAAIEKIDEIEVVGVCDVDEEILLNCKHNCFKTTNYKDLTDICDHVLIASPPNTHFEIAKYFIEKGVHVIIEKPIVISMKELHDLQELLKKHNTGFYNTLHFSFGNEILWAKQNLFNEKPQKIKALICDKYVKDCHILENALSLNGAYLDESINPLSAICCLLQAPLNGEKLETKKFDGDIYDYYSVSNFTAGDIPIEIEVDWARDSSEKYIDLFFKDKTIRLDSMAQSVIDLKDNRVLFKSEGDRMSNHYFNSLRKYLKNGDNHDFSYKLHKELLKIYEN